MIPRKRPLLQVTVFSVFAIQMSCGVVLQTSTFDTGNDGWQPWSTSTVGALSPGNPYLAVAADGSGVLGKAITVNMTSDWQGDYFATGVTDLMLDVSNMSDSDLLDLRVVVGNRASPMQSGGTWWIGTTAFTQGTLSPWEEATLSLREADLKKVGDFDGNVGSATYEETFRDIRNIRILSAAVALAPIGDEFIGTVALDNIRLVVPEPSVPFLLLFATSLGIFRRSRESA